MDLVGIIIGLTVFSFIYGPPIYHCYMNWHDKEMVRKIASPALTAFFLTITVIGLCNIPNIKESVIENKLLANIDYSAYKIDDDQYTYDYYYEYGVESYEDYSVEEPSFTIAKAIVEHIKSEKHLNVPEEVLEEIVIHAFDYAGKHGISPTTVLAVARYESTFNPNAKAKTSNASGLMQVIPRWHKEKIGDRNLFDIEVAIDVGSQVLSECKKRNKGSYLGMLKCYRGMKDEKYFTKITKYKEKLDYLVASM